MKCVLLQNHALKMALMPGRMDCWKDLPMNCYATSRVAIPLGKPGIAQVQES